MKFGDFSSLVQLGAGLHIGTAILQLYGDLGVQPLVRTMARIKNILAERNESTKSEFLDELLSVEGSFEIFKIQLFNEFKWYVKANTCVATLLVLILIFIAYKAEDTISAEFTVFVVAASILPAPITLFALWRDAARVLGPIKARADDLESRILRA